MCNVEILDNTDQCPLCHHVLEWDGIEREDTYPDARIVIQRFRFVENIVLFLSIVVFGVFVGISFWEHCEFGWTLLIGLALIYVNGLLRITILGKSSYLFKIMFSVLLAMLLLIQADIITGYQGWGVNVVYPVAIILLDIGILILMLINRKSWQSYIIVQISTLLLSGLGLIFLWLKIITFPYVIAAAGAFSLIIFVGTMIMGDYIARTELKRRFHI